MRIHTLTAVFGRLQNETLQLKEGLNIIQAPNETGKSTWCAFLSAMLYGINSRERDRAGFIADKNRYAPWDASPMVGRMDCCLDGQELTITRNTRRPAAPMADFQALYTGTGTPVSELTGANCGEALLGVTREVFERSAFIRQNGIAITQNTELERRVTSLISSGDEDTSYTEAHDALKKQLNRRRFNKSGQLPALEEELAEVQRQLASAEATQQQLSDAQSQVQALEQAAAALAEELAQHDQWESAQKRRHLADVSADAEQARQRAQTLEEDLTAERVPTMEAVGRLRGAIVNLETVRKSVDHARAEKDEAMKLLLRAEQAVSDHPFAGKTPEELRQEAAAQPKVTINSLPSLAVLFLMLAAALGLALFLSFQCAAFSAGWMRGVPWILFAAIAAAAALISRKMRLSAVSAAQSAVRQKRFGSADPEQIAALINAYDKLVETRDAMQTDVNARSATTEALYNSLITNEQAILLEVRRFAPEAFDIPAADAALRLAAQRRKALSEARIAAQEAQLLLNTLTQQNGTVPELPEPAAAPQRDRETIAAEYARIQGDLSAARSRLDQLSGQLHAMGDPAVLQTTSAALQAQIDQSQEEYDALRLAMEVLTHANAAIQNRFSPQLSRRTAEIFRELTGGRYTSTALDRSFHLTAQLDGDLIDRDIALLSAGTADQLYLAARLAICQLVLPPEKHIPLILDDALTNFDDERCQAALRWLKEESKTRQILLFTCHTREAAFFQNDPTVFIQKL